MMPSRYDEVFPFNEADESSLIQGGSAFEEVMYSINADQPVSRRVAKHAMREVLNNEKGHRDSQLGALLMGSTKIATPELVAGFVDSVMEFEGKDTPSAKKEIDREGDEIIVGCAGSGKKGVKTVNITTPAMIVAAAAGVKALKAGSRASSSLTGSTDILELVGFKTPVSEENSTQLMHDTNFGFYSIEHTTPNFDQIYGNKFFAPHALSFVLPATLLPVRIDTLFYGYAGPNVSLSASSFVELGYPSVLVCNNTSDGTHYIDEMTTVGTTSIAGAIEGKVGERLSFDAACYMGVREQGEPGIESRPSLAEQRKIFLDILEARAPGSIAENTVCLNAATILYLAKRAATPKEGFGLAIEVIRSGGSAKKLQEIIEASHDIVVE